MHETFIGDHYLKPVGIFWPWFLAQQMVVIDQFPHYTVCVFRSRPRWSTPQVIFIYPESTGSVDSLDLREIIAIAESPVYGSIYTSTTFPLSVEKLMQLHGLYWYYLRHGGRDYHFLLATRQGPEKRDMTFRVVFLPIPTLSFGHRNQLQRTSSYHTMIYEDFQTGYASVGVVIPSEEEDVLIPIGMNQSVSIKSNSRIDIVSVQ